MKIGDRVFIHGYVDEIRKETVIIRNKGGYFGTDKSEVIVSAKDVEPVVRCKDCKWWGGNKNTEHNNHMCNRALNQDVEYWTRADDYCSYGERKGGDDK